MRARRCFVVEPLKNLCEVAVAEQAGQHLRHVVDAGIPDDEAVGAPEVAAVQGLAGVGPPVHDACDLGEREHGCAPA